MRRRFSNSVAALVVFGSACSGVVQTGTTREEATLSTPTTPTHLVVVGASRSSVALDWWPGEAQPIGFVLARAQGTSAPACSIAGATSLASTVTHFVDDGLAAGDYTYVLCARGAQGDLSPPAVVRAHVWPCAPPQNLAAGRIGRMQLGVGGLVSDKSVLAGKADLIWGDYFQDPGLAKVPGTYSMKYMMGFRDPDAHWDWHSYKNTSYPDTTLDWYLGNHPDWVMYLAPGAAEPLVPGATTSLCASGTMTGAAQNPAYECFFANSVNAMSLDVSQWAVREYLLFANLESVDPSGRFVHSGNYWVPTTYFSRTATNAPTATTLPSVYASASTDPTTNPTGEPFYNALSIDNLGVNAWRKYGTSGHALYPGGEFDPHYIDDEVAWLEYVAAQAHANDLCVVGNDYLLEGHAHEFAHVADPLDMVLDEHGFTRMQGATDTDGNWLDRQLAYQALVAAGKGLVSVDYAFDSLATIEDDRGNLRDFSNISWSIANYLLWKNDFSYLALTAQDMAPGAQDTPEYNLFPQLYDLFLHVGEPVDATFQQRGSYFYSREFDAALALVNASTQQTGSYDLGARVMRGLDGRLYTGTLSLPPTKSNAPSALVLTPVPQATLPSVTTSAWKTTNVVASNPGASTLLLTESSDGTTTTSHAASASVIATSGTGWMLRIDAKSDDRQLRVVLADPDDSGNATLGFDCPLNAAGVAWQHAGGEAALQLAQEVPLGDGWVRCMVSGRFLHRSAMASHVAVTLELVKGQTAGYAGDGKSAALVRSIELDQDVMPERIDATAWAVGPVWTESNLRPKYDWEDDARYTMLYESLDAAGSTPVHALSQKLEVDPSVPWTLTITAKAAGEHTLYFGLSDPSEPAAHAFMSCGLDAATGESVATGSYRVSSAVATGEPDGWVTCSLSGSRTASQSEAQLGVYLQRGGTVGFSGNGSYGVKIRSIALSRP